MIEQDAEDGEKAEAVQLGPVSDARCSLNGGGRGHVIKVASGMGNPGKIKAGKMWIL